ncbi:MAG: thiamine ABC transporter substrate-binding protein [Acidimicrobiales bacterium]
MNATILKSSALALAVGVLSLAGCSKDATDTATDSSAGGRPTITIVTYDSYVLDKKVKATVEKDLGVKLEVHASGDGAEALAAAILTAGRPEGDIFFGVDNTLLSRAVDGKVFDRVDTATDVPQLQSVPAALRLDDTGHLVPVDVGPVCVDYDRQWFDEHHLAPPTSLADLTDPRYKDLLVVESPVTSSTGLVFLVATHAALGSDAAKFWTDLVANGVSVSGSWTDAWETQYTVSGGDRPLVLSYASSPPAEVVYSDGKVTTPRTGVVTATCADQIEFAGVLRGSKHPAKAAQVLNAMLGTPWQASLPLANFVYPARSDVAEPDLFTKFAPRPSTSIRLDPAAIAEHRDAWIDEWRTIAG